MTLLLNIKKIVSTIRFSKCIIIVFAVVGLFLFVKISKWNKEKVFAQDALCYYGYLPATFIYHDITLGFLQHDKSNYLNNLWGTPMPDGKIVIKTTMGLAYLYAPFFFVAEGIALITPYKENGFSLPFQIALCLSSLVYALLALVLLRKILLRFFTDFITGITLLTIFIGTNILYYVFVSPLMSHSYSFFVLTLFLFLFLKWYEKPTLKISFCLGFVIGIIILVRPVNSIVLLIPLLYKGVSKNEWINKWYFVKKNYFKLIIAAMAVFLALLPQLIYWKITTGNFSFYSYVGERFFFDNPHIMEGLFGFRKGWLVYTPAMVFSLVGFFFLKNKVKDLFIAIPIFTLINIYIMFSWWSWWYGGGFGCRPIIDSYSLLAIPMAAFFAYIAEKKIIVRTLIGVVLVGLILLNIFQNYQTHLKLIHWDGMTYRAYCSLFLKTHFPKNINQLISQPNYENAAKGVDEKEFPSSFIALKTNNGKYCSAKQTLIANKEEINFSEKILLFDLGNDSVKMLAYNGYYVEAKLNCKSQPLIANENENNKWQLFKFIKLKTNFVVLQACNGKFVGLDSSGTRYLTADRNTINDSEKFVLEYIE